MKNETWELQSDGTMVLVSSITLPDPIDDNQGEATLAAGRATIQSAKAKQGMMVIMTRMQGTTGNIGNLYVYTPATVDGVSFQVRSTNAADTGSFGWQIIDE